MKKLKTLKEYLGLPTINIGGLDSYHPIASLGDTPPKRKGSRDSRATGLMANYDTQAPGTMRPFLTADAKTKQQKNWKEKGFGPYKFKKEVKENFRIDDTVVSKIDKSMGKGHIVQIIRPHTYRKEPEYIVKWSGPNFVSTARREKKHLIKADYQIEDAERVSRKPGQKANSKKHSDLYTDENPKGTIHGLGFTDAETARTSVNKIKNSGKTHAHKIQAAIAMSQRAKVASERAKDPKKKKNLGAAHRVYQTFIDTNKKKD